MVSSIKVNNTEPRKQSFGKRSREKLISYKNMAATTFATFGAFGITDYFVDEFLDSGAETKKIIRKTAKKI